MAHFAGPVAPDRIERLLSSIQRQLEVSGESEITSAQIGEMVMEALRALDTVAYIRFASVYKDFREARDFEEFAGTVVLRDAASPGSSPGSAAPQDERK
jgi:transcriptional repressor NrdR